MLQFGDKKEAHDASILPKPPEGRRQLSCESDGTVDGASIISNSSLTPFTDVSEGSHFGVSVTAIGDLDGDDIVEIAVGSYNDNDGGSGAGAVYVLFLTNEGFVKDAQKISNAYGSLSTYFTLAFKDFFGISVAGIGDLDGDSIQDIACGAMYDDDGGGNSGAAYILYLETSGAVKNAVKISNSYGGFPYFLETAEKFGSSLAKLDDLGGDFIVEIAVGAIGCDDGASNSGSIYIVFLQTDGGVSSAQKISNSAGSLSSYYTLGGGDSFGWALASLGDINSDTVCDAVVGSNGDDSGSENSGAVLVIFLSNHGKVMGGQKISNLEGRLASFVTLNIDDYFGRAVGNIGDINADGIVDIGVGAFQDNDGGTGAGAVYVLMLRTDGNIMDAQKISAYFGGLSTFASLEDNGYFGRSVSAIGDLDGNGVTELIVGAHWAGKVNTGAAFVVFLSQTSCNSLQPTSTPMSNIAALNYSNPTSSSIAAGSAELWISIGIIVVIVFAIVGKTAAGIYFKEKELALKSSECIETMDDPWSRGSSTMMTPNDFESSGEANNASEVFDSAPEAVAIAVPIGDISTKYAQSPSKRKDYVKNRFRRAVSRCKQNESKKLGSILESDKCIVGAVCEKMGVGDGNYTRNILQNECATADSMMRDKMNEDRPPALFARAFAKQSSCSWGDEINAANTGTYQRTSRAMTGLLNEAAVSLDEVSNEIKAEMPIFYSSNNRRGSQEKITSLDETITLDSLVPGKVNQTLHAPAQDSVNVHVAAEDAFTTDTSTTQRTSIDFPDDVRETI